MPTVIKRQDLLDMILVAKKRVRFLGVLAIDFDWELVRDSWFEKINAGVFDVHIIRESDSLANNISIITSNKIVSGADRGYRFGDFQRTLEAPRLLRDYLVNRDCKFLEPVGDVENEEKQHFSLKTCYLQIPIPVVNVDDNYYYTMSLTNFYKTDKFELVDESHPWKTEFVNYFNAYFDDGKGANEYSTEETKKGNRLEVINAYNSERAVMFPLPRDSFPDIFLAKLVVWAFVFTRDGKMLIHKRGNNAKDNQNLWDKSVGGHVDPRDVDSAKAAAREIAEELYQLEADGQGNFGKTEFINANKDKMIFLGEWNTQYRNEMPFHDVQNKKGENFYFRLNYSYSTVDHRTVRNMPDGSVVKAHTFVDLYACIASKDFTINELKNSEYRLVELHELTDQWLGLGEDDFELTPDMQYIITSTDIYDQLSEFSEYIKLYSGRNSNSALV